VWFEFFCFFVFLFKKKSFWSTQTPSKSPLRSPAFSSTSNQSSTASSNVMCSFDLLKSFLSSVVDFLKRLRPISKFPFFFVPRFPLYQDIIDILLGWCVSGSVDEETRTVITNFFQQVPLLWAQNAASGMEILGSLVRNIDALLEKRTASGESTSTLVLPLVGVLDAFGAITTAHQAAQRTVGVATFAKAAGCPNESALAQRELQRVASLLGSFERVLKKTTDKRWLVAANECVRKLSGCLGSAFDVHLRRSINFLIAQLSVPQLSAVPAFSADIFRDLSSVRFLFFVFCFFFQFCNQFFPFLLQLTIFLKKICLNPWRIHNQLSQPLVINFQLILCRKRFHQMNFGICQCQFQFFNSFIGSF
jgi:hypothetical protein